MTARGVVVVEKAAEFVTDTLRKDNAKVAQLREVESRINTWWCYFLLYCVMVLSFGLRDENIKAIEWSPRCGKLDKAVSGRRRMDMMIVYLQEFDEKGTFGQELSALARVVSILCMHHVSYRAMCEDQRLAWQINALCDTLTDVIERRKNFVAELDMLVLKFMPGKMAEFMKETLNKDVSNLMKLQILGREFELRAREKDLFIEKLKVSCRFSIDSRAGADVDDGVPAI
nr:hypothetical protein [Tanacetum cinerariifolium]